MKTIVLPGLLHISLSVNSVDKRKGEQREKNTILRCM